MILQNMISKKTIAISIFILILFSGIIINTTASFANDSISPESIELYTLKTSDSAQTYEEIYIKVLNNPLLFSKTNDLGKELVSKGDKLKGTALQIQSKADSGSWKTHNVEDYDYIKSSDKISEIKISNTAKINLNKHTLYIKARYAWITEKGSIYYDSWSCVSVIGKDADSVVFPDEIAEAPVFSDASAEINNREIPVINTSFKSFPKIITSNFNNPTGSLMMNIMISENGGEYRNVRFQPLSTIEPEKNLQSSILDKNKEYKSGSIKIKARYEWYNGGASYYGIKEPDVVSPWSDEITKEINLWSNASKWVIPYLNSAKEMNLFPACLMAKDMKNSITRAEFSAAAIKLYETMTDTTLTPSNHSLFSDCDDNEVLKAYSVGFVNGISESEFSPDSSITREQAAVILTRVYKKLVDNRWSLKRDYLFKLNYNNSIIFSDDYLISDYAKESVYFMGNNKIIEGIEKNKFAPNNGIEEYSNKNLGNMTRQQTIVIMMRMFEKFS